MSARVGFEVQGHRGARGLLPENTLPSFEIALDLGVTSIETDVHLTRDDVPVLFHDPTITERLCGSAGPLVRSLTLAELRAFRIGPPGTQPTPLAQYFAQARGFDPFGIPTLAEFFEFVHEYITAIGKTTVQQERARRLVFDLELKRVPFTPETIGDDFDGSAPALLEHLVVAAIRTAGALARTRVRSFDHRCVWAIKQLEPTLETGVLIYETAPRDVGGLLAAAQADMYCPDYHFVDAEIVRQVRTAGKRIIPYTVNEPEAWARLIEWGVDGVTTDYPDRLLQWLGGRDTSAM